MTTSNTPSIPNGDAHSRDAKASSHPTDWPGPGPIDLNIHDLPHQTANTEWWYANGHFTAHVPGDEDKPGRNFSFFVAFFKLWLDEESYVINWGLLDADKGELFRRFNLRDVRLTLTAMGHREILYSLCCHVTAAQMDCREVPSGRNRHERWLRKGAS